jgi:carboxypeptidase C (cathepsin A)
MGDDVPDFRGAFVEEMTGEPEAPEVEEVEEKPDTEVEDAEVEKTEEKVEKTEEEAAEGEEEKKKEDEEEEDDKPEFATKQDIEDALRRNQDASVEHVNNVVKARDEIIEKLHPEGVDTNVYDTNGEIVKTAQDIVDRGLVKANGEPFTYEEAASYMLEAGRQSAENIQKLQDYATEVAEQNISLYESNQRVIEKWGDVLNTMPNLRTNLAKEYMETQLEFDPTGSYITKMHSTPERFYALTVGPYVELAEALANKEAAQAQEQARSQQDEQAERTGLPPQRGQAAVKSNTGDPMLDALIDEMNS